MGRKRPRKRKKQATCSVHVPTFTQCQDKGKLETQQTVPVFATRGPHEPPESRGYLGLELARWLLLPPPTRDISRTEPLSTLREHIAASSLPLLAAHMLCWNHTPAKDPAVQRSSSLHPFCASVTPFCATVAATLVPPPQAQRCKTSTWSTCFQTALPPQQPGWTICHSLPPPQASHRQQHRCLKNQKRALKRVNFVPFIQHCTKNNSDAKGTADALQLLSLPLENWLLKNTTNSCNNKKR